MVGYSRTAARLRTRTPRDVLVSGDVLTKLSTQAPLTVVRGPRGYGKTTVLDAWLERGGADHRTVVLSLDRSCNVPAVFWARLADALEDGGILASDGAPGTDQRERVVSGLSRLDEPLTIVIDDYHEAGRQDDAADIDEDVVELVRQNDQLYVVVATRATRVVETTGSLSVDVTVISPHDLRLGPEQVLGLGERLGVVVGEREAVRLAVGFGGWPAAIRDVLVRSRGEGGRLNIALADAYIAAMVRDLRHEQVRSFLLRTAVPESFDAELAQRVAPGDDTLTILRNIRAAGLVEEDVDGEQRSYAYAPMVRQALVRLLSESQPKALREVHRTLMDWHRQRRDPLAELVHAIHAAEWDTVEQVMEEEWHHLVTQEPAVLMAAAQLIPPEIVATHPRFRVARDEVDGALLGDTTHPALLWPTGDIRGITANLRPGRGRTGMDGATFALLQWGVAAVLAGDESAALYAFGRARTVAQETPGAEEAVTLATAALACTHAIYGDAEIADGWLADLTAADARADEVAGYWLRLARALVALDRLSADLPAAIAALPDRPRRDEVWGLQVFVQANYAAVAGPAEEIARWAANVRAARHYLPSGRMGEILLRATEVEILLVGGMVEEAQEIAEDLPEVPPTLSTHARLALAAGDHRTALARSRDALGQPGMSQRSVMECQLVMAAAHLAMGERGAARAAFADAVHTAYASGQRRPLLALRYATFATLAGEDERVLGLWPEEYRPPAEEVTERPRGGLREVLTPRELEILQSLHEHPGAVPIAQAMELSVNTVKSHLRSIYHKLGVTTRAGALRRAEEIDRIGATSRPVPE